MRCLWVHDDTIQQRSGLAAGVLGSNPVFLSQGNRFTGNSYLLGDTIVMAIPLAACQSYRRGVARIRKRHDRDVLAVSPSRRPTGSR
jgi:hypothetical protein